MSAHANFEVFEAAKGDYRWRLRDQDGKVVSIKPGKVFGLGNAKALKPYRDAANTVLSYHVIDGSEPGARSARTTDKG